MAGINDFFGSTVDESVADSTTNAFSNMNYDITRKQRTKWQRNRKRTSKSTKSSGTDRFIPVRDEHKFDQQQSYHGAGHKPPGDDDKRDDSVPADNQKSSKILSFQAAAPEAADGYISNLRTLYTVSSARSSAATRSKNTRHICQTAKRVLDAPDLRDDYYLNLLHWGRTNQVAIGLGSCLYLWDAADGSINLLVDLGEDTQV